MKNNYKNHISLSVLLFISLAFNKIYSQCGVTYYAGLGVPSAGTTFTTWANFGPGQYFAFPVLSGGSYAISTCGAGIDTQLSGYDASATNLVFYNDDNGPICGGSAASVDNYVPNFTNYMYIQVTQYYCIAGGSSSINLYLRQNDNINFTSSSASMCSGETRILSATPANVGSSPGGYGNPGTFSGTGVSGGIFTAPVVVVPTNYTITYTFGYVSHTQVITVNPIPVITANTASICQGNQVTLTANGASTYTWSGGITNGVPFSPLVSGSYSVSGTSSLGCVSAEIVKTISVSPSPTLLLAPTGTAAVYVGSGQTINSNWSPWVFNFTDPLPPNSNITGIDLIYNGVDQGFGGTGAPASMYVSDDYIGQSVLLHSVQSLTINYLGSIPNYTYGATNTLKMYFWGYPGWQAFITNANMIIHYETTKLNVCAGNTVALSASGAVSYAWTGGVSNNVAFTPTATTGYTITGTGANGCTSFKTQTVVVNPLPIVTVAGSGSICMGASSTQTASGASTYSWNTGATGSLITLSPTVTTTYVLSGTNAATGCSNTASKLITVNPLPTITVNSGSICSGNSFTMSPSGASSYTFQGSNAVVSPLSNTNYTVMGTNGFGCVSATYATANVTVNATPVVAVNSGSICAGSSFTMVPSGANTYNYQGGSAIVSPTANTSYTVVGTSTAGCVSAGFATSNVTVNAIPVITVNSGSICAGNSFTIVPSGANSYAFQGGSAVVSPLSNSSYTVTGTSAAGCVASSNATSNVSVAALPTISVNSGTLCSGTSFTIVPTGANTYTFQGGSAIVSPLSSTSYTVRGTSSVGCLSQNFATSSVTVFTSPTIASNSGTICSGNAFTISPSGANSYTYSGGTNIVTPLSTTNYSISGTSLQGCVSLSSAVSSVVVNTSPTITVNSGAICLGNSFSINPIGATTYTYLSGGAVVSPTLTSSYSIVGTSALGCISTNTAVSNVTVNPLPVLSISGNTVLCIGSAVSQTVSGASTYTWNTGSNSSVVSLNPSSNTTYTVSGTNGSTGCSNSAFLSISVAPLPIINVNSGNICAGQVFTFVPSGASTYSYSSGSNTVSPLTNSSYFVSGTSSLGCVSSGSAISNVIVNPAPIIVLNSGGICAGGSFTITPGGASTYTFLNGSSIVSPASNTSYSVIGTSVLGCVSNTPGVSNVTVNPLPVIAVNSGSVCSGSVFTIVPTGASTYTYAGGSNLVSPLVNTSYTVTGTSAAGCVAASAAVSNVTVTALPIVSVNSGTVCVGSVFTMTPSNAVTYTFSNGSSTVIPSSGISSYSVVGTNALGCVSSNTAVASVTTVALPTISVNSGIVCSGQTFTLVPTGGISYTFSSGSATVNPIVSSNYSVSGTNAQGCVSNFAVASITVNALPTLTIITTPSICAGSAVNLLVFGASNYTWNTAATGSVITVSPSQSTTYSVTAFSANGCSGSSSQLITVNPLPTITVAGGAICPGDLFVLNPSGANTYTYSSGSNTVMPMVTTSYSVTGTNINGCESLQPAVVTVSAVNTVTLNVSGNFSICTGQTASLTASGATTYTWNIGVTGSTIALSPSGSSTYTLIGQSGSCSDTAVVAVVVNSFPTLNISSSSSVICVGESATISVSGATSYVWSNSSNGSSAIVSPTATSTYTVIGTDENGCSTTITLVQNVAKCTGVESLSKTTEFLFNIYPNPNAGEFYIETSTLIDVEIYTAMGQLIFADKFEQGINKINLNEHAKGIYFVQLKENNQIKTFKLIKE